MMGTGNACADQVQAVAESLGAALIASWIHFFAASRFLASSFRWAMASSGSGAFLSIFLASR